MQISPFKIERYFARYEFSVDFVLLLPGTVYDAPGNHFRIGFGHKDMQEAVGRLEDFLQIIKKTF
jgi:hypothetical protein